MHPSNLSHPHTRNTQNSMAQLGYHPGASFLDAWATALYAQLHQAQEQEGKKGGGRNTRKHNQQRHHHRSLLDHEEEEEESHMQDPLQNLSLAFVVRA